MPKKKSNKKKKRAARERAAAAASASLGAAPVTPSKGSATPSGRDNYQATWGSTRSSADRAREQHERRPRTAKSTERITRKAYRELPAIADRTCGLIERWNRSETEGGALVGAVLGLGTRMESIRKLQMSKAREDVLQLFGGINARLQQRHIEDFEDAMHNLQLILKSFEEIVAGLRSCADDAAQLMATVQSDPAIEAEPAVLLRVAFAPPTLARPVPLEALVRYTRDLTREYAHEYWRKLDLVASVRYTNLSMLETLTNEWSTSSISSPFNTDLVDALTLTLASVVQ